MPVKPLARLSTAVRVLFLVYLGLTVLTVAAALAVYTEYDRVADIDRDAMVYTVSGADVFAIVVGLLSGVCYIGLSVVFLVWCYRLSKNLHLLSGDAMKYSPGWAVGWWFIPFANLVMPYKVMRELWRAAHGSPVPPHGLLKWWWATWLVSGFVDGALWRVGGDGLTVGDYVDSSIAQIVMAAFSLIAIIVTTRMVARIVDAYERTIGEPSARWLPAPAPPWSLAPGPAVGQLGPGQLPWPPAGWYPDPSGRHEVRYWDAVGWTPYVGDGGVPALDPA